MLELRSVVPSHRLDSDLVSEAVVVRTGYDNPTTSSPERDEGRIVERFGSELAVELMPVLTTLEDAFYLSDARLKAKNLETMAELAQRDFARLHPEISAEASRALACCYTFDFK